MACLGSLVGSLGVQVSDERVPKGFNASRFERKLTLAVWFESSEVN